MSAFVVEGDARDVANSISSWASGHNFSGKKLSPNETLSPLGKERPAPLSQAWERGQKTSRILSSAKASIPILR